MKRVTLTTNQIKDLKLYYDDISWEMRWQKINRVISIGEDIFIYKLRQILNTILCIFLLIVFFPVIIGTFIAEFITEGNVKRLIDFYKIFWVVKK